MTTQHSEGLIPEWTLGDRLRKARSVTGMTVREFAEHIGVSHGTITNAETDARTVRKIVLNAYSLATGVPVEWLETGDAPSSPTPDPGAAAEGGKWAPWDSNPQPKGSRSAQVSALPVRVIEADEVAAA